MKYDVSVLALIALLTPRGAISGPPSERARRLNQQALVFDAHCDTALDVLREQADLGARSDQGHIDIPRMRAGGLKAQVFALWVEPDFWPQRAAHRALQMADALLAQIDKHADSLALAISAGDIRRIVAQGKIAVLLGIEGGFAIEDDLALLRMFHRLGVRVLTLTWMEGPAWASAADGKPHERGLTELGKTLVREMNRLGVVIDLSHASEATFRDALEVTTKPVIVSHSCCRALCDIYRNVSDDQLRQLKKNGGVIGINFFPAFLDPVVAGKMEKLWGEIEALEQRLKDDPVKFQEQRKALVAERVKDVPPVPLDRLIDHIDHAVKVAGIDSVALGSDFDGISLTPTGLNDVSCLPLITDRLLARGYGEDDIRKILGGNLLRVFVQALGE